MTGKMVSILATERKKNLNINRVRPNNVFKAVILISHST